MLLLFKSEQFLLKIVDSSVQVVGAVIKHAHSLITARLIVKNYYDHVPVNIFTFVCIIFENLLRPLKAI